MGGTILYLRGKIQKLSKPPRRWKIPHFPSLPSICTRMARAKPINKKAGEKSKFLDRAVFSLLWNGSRREMSVPSKKSLSSSTAKKKIGKEFTVKEPCWVYWRTLFLIIRSAIYAAILGYYLYASARGLPAPISNGALGFRNPLFLHESKENHWWLLCFPEHVHKKWFVQ